MPIAIETSGVFGSATAVFIKELGHRLRRVTGDDLSHHHLVQHLSVAVQRGNCVTHYFDLYLVYLICALLILSIYFIFII